MIPSTLRMLLLGAALFVVLPVRAADDKDDPLPKDAKLRLGSDRLAFRVAPASAMLPPDYKTFLIPDAVRGFRRFDVATGKALDEAKGVGFPGGYVVVSGDGKRGVLTSSGLLTVREVATGKAVQELKPPMGFSYFSSTIPGASFSDDGKVIAQGGQGGQGKDIKGEVIVWDVDSNNVLAHITTPLTGPAVPVLSGDGKLLATRALGITFTPPGGKEDPTSRTIQVWEVATRKELFKAPVPAGGFQITACVFSPDGSLLAVSTGDGSIDLWDVKTGKLATTLLGRSGQGVRVAFSPDGKTLAALGGTDASIQRWAVPDGKPLGITEAPAELPPLLAQGLAFAGKDRVVAWGAAGSVAVAWEAPAGKMLTPLGEHTAGIRSIAFADDGKQIITAGMDGNIVKWDAATGKKAGIVALRPARSPFAAAQRLPVNLSPDATRAVSIGTPTAVFDLTTGVEQFAIPRGAPIGFNFYSIPSADASRVVSVSVPFDTKKNPNGTVAVWDLASRKKVMEVEIAATAGYPPAAAVSPSGERLVVARYSRVNDQPTMQVTGYDLKTGKKLGEIDDTTAIGQLFVTAASEKTAIVSSGPGRLRMFDYEDGKGGDEIEANGRGEQGGPVVFSPDGKRFAFGVSVNQDTFGVRIYDWPSGKAVHTFAGHRAPVTALRFSPDGKTLASGSHDTTVLLWDLTKIGEKPK